MILINSADSGRIETLTIEPRGTAGQNGSVRLVRVEIADPILGEVGINVDLLDLAALVRQFGLMFPGDAFAQSGDDTIWGS